MNEPIAIIGIGCRFPGGANDPASFWKLLKEGHDAIREIPPDRWSIDAFYDPAPGRPGKSISRWGGFVDGIDHFDPEFFGISRREAASMDPQHRLLLQTAWEALEDGGVIIELERRVGVFVGISTNDYAQLQIAPADHLALNPWSATGGVASIAANRISSCFDLHGPSFAVDTACSSSLVALHLACESLHRGECPLALVGGANALLLPAPFVSFSRSGMLSPDGRCKAFDARANGFVRAEGAGVIVLKPMSKAVADGDLIYAVIRGTAVNQDGHTNGLSVPSAVAQAELIGEACRRAGVRPGQIRYVEAHGTGTAVGDPIEAAALAATVGDDRDAGDPCVVGSVKTNIGHLEAGAGIAGLIKTALVLFHRQVPPNLHFESPNPKIDFTASRLRVPRALEVLRAEGEPPLAGVNSFGFGGTNAHAILEAAPSEPAARTESATGHLLALSARSEAALRELALRYEQFLGESTRPLADLCYTAGARRAAHPYRLAIAAPRREELLEKLGAFRANESRAGLTFRKSATEPPRPVFVFSGQGPQWWGMGRELLEEEEVFRSMIEQCDQMIRELGDWSLLEELRKDERSSRLQDTAIAQPAIFSLQMALVALWKSWGIVPAAVVGHSVGEAAAACAAGVLTLRDALRVIYHRGRSMSLVHEEGRMLSVGMAPAEAEELLRKRGVGLSLAAINSPRSVVLSGDSLALEQLAEALQDQGKQCRFLPVNYAFHSGQMDPVREDLLHSLGQIPTHAPSVHIISTVTGAAQGPSDFEAEYWWRNVRQPVQFAQAISAVVSEGHRLFVEVGPHPVLASALRECLDHAGESGVILPSLRRKEPERTTLLGSLGALHALGHQVNWRAIYPFAKAARLPAYAWQNERYWSESADWTAVRATRAVSPLLQHSVPVAGATWQTTLDLDSLAYLKDHRVYEQMVFPAAAYIEMCLGAASALGGDKAPSIEGLEFRTPLVLQPDPATCLQWTQHSEDGSFSIASSTDRATWSTHATGQVGYCSDGRREISFDAIRSSLAEEVSGARSRQVFATIGLNFGPAFHGLDTVYRRDGEALGRIILQTGLRPDGYCIHPALLDACLQVLSHALPRDVALQKQLYLPSRVDRVRMFNRPGNLVWSRATLRHHNRRSIVGDIEIFDEQGRLLLEVVGLRCQAVTGGKAKCSGDDWCHQFRWEECVAESTPGPDDTRPAQTWLILADHSGCGTALATRLRSAGQSVICVSPACSAAQRGGGQHDVRPDSSEDIKQVIAQLRTATQPEITGIIHLWNLDANDSAGLDTSTLTRAQTAGCYSLISLIQALAHEQLTAPVWIITRGAQSILPTDVSAVAQAPVWGAGRVLLNEFPNIRTRLIDLPPEASAADVEILCQELALDDREEEVGYRGGRRYGHRLANIALHELPPRPTALSPSQGYRLMPGAASGIDQLKFTELPRVAPAAGEVAIEVHASALNFRDVLKALGMYPTEDESDELLGDECAGQIISVGEGVKKFAVGDSVVAMGPGCFSSQVILPEHSVMHRPETIAPAEAATIPVAFLTAWYALHHLARLRPGERVLIHAAAGGVGLAAIQVARFLGAEIFATAGSPEKREYLRTLGVRHVSDSRTLSFAEEIRELTGGRGVDAVLNSLSGEAIGKGIGCLAPGGRFLEIGKRDIYQNAKLGLRPFRNNLSFFAIDLAQLLREEPEQIGQMLGEVMEHFRAGHFQPLPVQKVPLPEARDAFRQMSQARHIGKIALIHAQPPPLDAGSPVRFRADATYLITGGFGGFGLAVGEWMLRHGARHLVIAGRSANATGRGQAAVERLRALGGEILPLTVDVANPADIDHLFKTIGEQLPPLRGIMHSAMVIDDSTLLQETPERFRRVMAPKVEGAWNLHTRSLRLDLDFFVFFSSISGLIGNPGQGSYAAANSFLDALAHYRRAIGLPALTIDWGVLSDVGYVARTPGLNAVLDQHGLAGFSSAEATSILGRLLQTGAAQVGAFRVNWAKTAEAIPALGHSPRFHLLASGPASQSPDGASSLASILALPAAERVHKLTTQLAEHAAHVLLASATRIDPARPLGEVGLDSLMAVEFANRVEAAYGQRLPIGTIRGESSLVTIAEAVLKLAGSAESVLPATPSAPSEDLNPPPEMRSPETPPPLRGEFLASTGGTATLPASPQPSARQDSLPTRLQFYGEWLLLRTLLGYFRLGPLERAQRQVRRLVPVATWIFRHDWKWALQNLRLIFGPHLTDSERSRLASLAFEHHLYSYLEGLRHADVKIDFHHPERLFEAHATGRGVILCGVHLGSWESVLPYAAKAGLPVVGVYRRAFNPLSDEVFQQVRASYGIEWIAAGETAAIQAALREGKIIGLMTDLNTTVGGASAEFLGVTATSPSGPARLALQHGAPIVPAIAIRSAVGQVKVDFLPAIAPPKGGDPSRLTQELTRSINAAFEPWIMEYAEQYNWMHPRWRNRPDGTRWALGMTDAELEQARTQPFCKLAERVRRLLNVEVS